MKTVARFLLTLVLVAAACAGGYELWDYYLFSPWTRDAHVQADVVGIAPDVAGFVDEVRVKDNQFVHKGDVLIVIDQARYTRALALAENVSQQAKRIVVRRVARRDEISHLDPRQTRQRIVDGFAALAVVRVFA